MEDATKAYFMQFGEVKSVGMHHNGDVDFSFVEFRTTEAASAVLSNATHRIANCDIEVKAAEPWHQPDHILNALDDDCLREVFKHLNKWDLTNAADVCVRFKQRAKEAFSVKYKKVSLYFHEFMEEPNEELLCIFGPMIQSLWIEREFGELYDDIVLKWIEEKTTSELKVLKLSKFTIDGKIDIHSTLANLEKLELDRCNLVSYYYVNKPLLAACIELKTLQIKQTNYRDFKCINQQFPKLEEISLVDSSALNDADLIGFVTLNPTLKKLVIENNHNVKSVEIIRVISQHLRNLVELGIDQCFDKVDKFQRYVLSLSQLNSLETLKINFNSMSIAPLMEGLATNCVPIENLMLKNGRIDTEAIESMSQLKQMKTLVLNDIDGLSDERFIGLAMTLPQLQKLNLDGLTAKGISSIALKEMLPYAIKLSLLSFAKECDFLIDVDDYEAILKTVQSRPEKVHLLVKIKGYGGIVDVPEEILAGNREWLYIDEEIEEDYEDDDYGYTKYSDTYCDFDCNLSD